ncbi:hypothetical protein RUM43_004302 [Polyplax serrata]|uniref:Uncharacterized protein n=1 Tax=Polyplax serrata TaxID=468196 RepID=A0AAN8SC50_POLSC
MYCSSTCSDTLKCLQYEQIVFSVSANLPLSVEIFSMKTSKNIPLVLISSPVLQFIPTNQGCIGVEFAKDSSSSGSVKRSQTDENLFNSPMGYWMAQRCQKCKEIGAGEPPIFSFQSVNSIHSTVKTGSRTDTMEE